MTTEERDHAMALALQKQLNMEGQQEAAARAAAAGHTMSGYIQVCSITQFFRYIFPFSTPY